ncbi:MAG TPA: zinc ribbon domain-containing protein [Burkholderiales bacterium]|nr:zinc ribbon domain-containing protein [Burkholderiales bacterium]
MPIYEYRCDSCGFQKEYLLRMSDAPLTDCPECKKATFSKMVTAAGFQLKGGGWYVTDFKGGGNAASSTKKNEEKQTDTNAKSEASKAEPSKAEPSKSEPVKTEKPKSEAAASSVPASSGSS